MLNENTQIRDGLLRPFRRYVLGPNAAVTGIAPVQAVPTTQSQWAIINATDVEANPERSAYAQHIFIEELGAYLTSGTYGLRCSLWAAHFTAPVTGTSDAGLVVANSHGGASASLAVVKSGILITAPAAPVWFPVAFDTSAATPAAFSAGGSVNLMHRRLKGRISIPPGCGLALAVLGPSGTSPLFAPVAIWTEQIAAVS